MSMFHVPLICYTRAQKQAAYDEVLADLARARHEAAGLYRSDKKAAKEMARRAQADARAKIAALRAGQRKR